MLKTEFDIRYAAAESKLMSRAYEDGIKQIFTMENCDCANMQELWMFALGSYDTTPGAVNILSERELQCLFCRMDADGALENLPTTPTPPPPVTLFTYDWAWMADDPYADLLIADNITYQGSAQAAPGSPLQADFRTMPNNYFNVVRYPVTESNKTEWIHNQFNYGVLPDQNYREVFTAHGYKYIVSRIALTFTAEDYTKFL
jgi:hypothetical protein